MEISSKQTKVIVPPTKTLPKFKGGNRWYLGFAGTDKYVLAVSLEYNYDKFRNKGNGLGVLNVRFGLMCQSPSLVDQIKGEGLPGFNPRLRQLFYLGDKGIDGLLMDKLELRVFEGPAEKIHVAALFKQFHILQNVAGWITEYSNKYGIALKCEVQVLAEELEDFFPPSPGSEIECVLSFPENLTPIENKPVKDMAKLFAVNSPDNAIPEPKPEDSDEISAMKAATENTLSKIAGFPMKVQYEEPAYSEYTDDPVED